jgi:[ribosomal protein S5]-alanine N-acetyltransferase
MSSEPAFPMLRTPRIDLVRIGMSDATAFFAIHADPANMRYWSTLPWTEPEQALAVIAADEEGSRAGTSYRFGLVERDGTGLIGYCSLHRIDRTHGRAEVGYILRTSHQGRGLIHEALGAVVDHAFDTIGLRRLEADIDPRNTASTRVVERLGFVREATMRARWLVGDEVSDTAFYGLLRDERPARGAKAA